MSSTLLAVYIGIICAAVLVLLIILIVYLSRRHGSDKRMRGLENFVCVNGQVYRIDLADGGEIIIPDAAAPAVAASVVAPAPAVAPAQEKLEEAPVPVTPVVAVETDTVTGAVFEAENAETFEGTIAEKSAPMCPAAETPVAENPAPGKDTWPVGETMVYGGGRVPVMKKKPVVVDYSSFGKERFDEFFEKISEEKRNFAGRILGYAEAKDERTYRKYTGRSASVYIGEIPVVRVCLAPSGDIYTKLPVASDNHVTFATGGSVTTETKSLGGYVRTEGDVADNMAHVDLVYDMIISSGFLDE